MNNNNKIMSVLDNSLVKQEYKVLLIFLAVAIVLTILIILTSYLLTKQNPDSEKLSAYECGFEPYEDTRHVFDIKFCLIAILFIIFWCNCNCSWGNLFLSKN